ncbi:hypothetical protein [Legionella sp. km772]|uniref:hypothetical protein n=1 Tax=Legionella sp. km772 TaxID=2498111 RepID=UPI000F8C7008|nr:hypothetical protein [Legionella sp. km772]RUR05552.1 hypothetical protein ELY15_14195 [Legionella sp. km772]
MPINDSQYNQCCDYLDELFAGLILKRHWENKEYIFTVSRSLMVERLFSSFKPLFQSSSYLEDSTSIQFNFKNLGEDSPLLTKEGLTAAYHEIPNKFSPYITAETSEISVYEREHFNQALKEALVQLPGLRIEDLKWSIQQHIDKYQSLFEHASSYKEKNAALIKMNNLYNISRNSNKLIQLIQEDKEEEKPPLEESKPSPEKIFFTRVPYKEERPLEKEERYLEKKETVVTYPHSKSGAISLSSILGILMGFAMLSWIIYTDSDSYRIFFSLDSFVFVLGATMACTMISYHGLYIFRALREIVQIFIPTHVSPSLLLSDVETLIKWSQRFKAHQQEKRPFRQLETLFSNYKDPDVAFMQTAIAFLLENYPSNNSCYARSILSCHIFKLLPSNLVRSKNQFVLNSKVI